MEGFRTNNLKAYDYLAYYYDLLLGDDESLNFWLKEIESEEFNTVLELASGTGSMAKILKNKGYDIIASDISQAMADASKVNYDGQYLILDMANYKLDKKFDLILCICDSLNYLNNNQLDSFFKCAYEHLNKNGRLIFDMHHIERLNEFEEEYVEEGSIEDINYQWTILADKNDNSLNEHFTFYTKEGMFLEQHKQTVYKPEEIIVKMKDTGFIVKYIEDFIKDEKVLMVGRK